MEQVTDLDIAYEVKTALGDWASEHNIAAIVRTLIRKFGLVHISEVDVGEFWEIVERHG